MSEPASEQCWRCGGDLGPKLCHVCRKLSEEHGEHELVTDGGTDSTGTEQRDPADDARACSLCGVHIGMLGDDYCDPCAREIGAKPPMERCMHCGRDGPREQMGAVDVSTENEYYPVISYLCGSCSGGGHGA